jgi:hypothetical protein
MLDDLSLVPRIEHGDIRRRREHAADQQGQEHQSSSTGVETVSLLEHDRVGHKEQVKTSVDEGHCVMRKRGIGECEKIVPRRTTRVRAVLLTVNGDGSQHGLHEQDGERFGNDILENGFRRLRSPFEGSPVSVVPGLFTQDLSLLDKQDGRVGLGDGE